MCVLVEEGAAAEMISRERQKADSFALIVKDKDSPFSLHENTNVLRQLAQNTITQCSKAQH